MSELYRFGVSLEKTLLDAFDRHIGEQHYKSRSEALRDLIREELLKKQWVEGGDVAGALVMTYDHHKRELVGQLLDVQHDFQETIISTQHIHLDHHHCLEIIAVKGTAGEVEKLATQLKVLGGVKHLSLSISTAG
ncbi:MAG: nickel-responsive transcriptional regulator NikR [Chlorobium sp.]|uniref:nickel-responsive transcriptional regulator NikR n=1 Tax=Chlorobium sp. TaxID=1095 RepID=UPI0025C524E2|nr:nickel-responsive transcriptional regulator NikR [Chlorobium sp.]MCF8383030.1 nickel-responsive transcriptional regulator NikR [Chlorobium sp.]